MAMLILASGKDRELWIKEFKKLDLNLDIRTPDEIGNVEDIILAFTWKHDKGVFNKFPNLKCIASKGAGVDHIVCDTSLPIGVPITKVVDEDLTEHMSEYILTAVLNYKRQFKYYYNEQAHSHWSPKYYLTKNKLNIGIMGLGKLGLASAQILNDFGFNISGWSRTKKCIDSIKSYEENELNFFLSKVNLLICLLPLTKLTNGILNYKLMNKLQRGSYIINVGRGKHLVENDLLEAINNGVISGACLDVFNDEPLPSGHPFWGNDKITITPHVSSITNPKSVAKQIYENYLRIKEGKQPLNQIDVGLEY